MKISLSDDFKSFFKVVLKDYWRVAAFYPTPISVVQKVLSRINPEAKYFIEYGAGNGAFTREILKKLPKDGKLVAIEVNQDFIKQLKKINDPRLILFPGGVERISQNLSQFGLPKIDVIVSGIPFSRINKKEREEIIKNSWQFLAKNGVFVTYQNVPVVTPVLKRHFKKINWYFDPRNLLFPYFVIFAKK